MNKCDSPISQPDCIDEIKTNNNCLAGPEAYCGTGRTYQPSIAALCLEAVESGDCEVLRTMPAECGPEVMCSSPSGGDPIPGPSPGQACEARESGYECNPQASLCYAAGKSSSCTAGGLCVGDSNGMTCAARCTADADCAAAGTGQVCLQDCKVTILQGFCVTSKAKTKFTQYACTNGSASSVGMSGWSL